MLIKFESQITTGDNKNKVAFTAPVQISNWNDFKVFEFIEPSMKEQNRIEVSTTNVNIFSGPNTLNLALGEKIEIEYFIYNAGRVFFQSQLHYLDIKDEQIDFSYSLHNKEILIGEYHITLTLLEN